MSYARAAAGRRGGGGVTGDGVVVDEGRGVGRFDVFDEVGREPVRAGAYLAEAQAGAAGRLRAGDAQCCESGSRACGRDQIATLRKN